MSENAAAARQRGDQDIQYQRGAVKKVELQNFMTYKNAIIEPGPRLNMVLGPNGVQRSAADLCRCLMFLSRRSTMAGTGKSSFVCALGVGLGAKLQLMARSSSLSAFVRRGSLQGETRITLCGGPGRRDIEVRRVIQADSGRSQWYLGGQSARQSEVSDLMLSLNIQMDNLCQFLPQDRVAEFAQLDARALLRATEAAVGSGELLTQHEALAAAARSERALAGSAATWEASLARSEAALAGLAPALALLSEREALAARARLAAHKLRRLAARRAGEEARAARHEAQRVQEQLRRALGAQTQGSGALKSAEQRHAKAGAAAKKATEEAAALARAVVARELPALQRATRELQEARAALESRRSAAEQRGRRLELLRQREEAAARSAAQPAPGRAEAERRCAEAEAALRDARARHEGAGLDAQLAGDELARAREDARRARAAAAAGGGAAEARLRALEASHRGLGEVAAWVRREAARGAFLGQVLGPVASLVELEEDAAGDVLEAHCGRQVWAYFVTERREDQDRLRREAQARGFAHQPTVLNLADDGGAWERVVLEAAERAEGLRDAGVTGTLAGSFRAPLLVRRALCEFAQLHAALLVPEADPEAAEKVFRRAPWARHIWTLEAGLTTRDSRHGGGRYTSIQPLRPCELLRGGGGAERRAAEALAASRDAEAQAAGARDAELRRAADSAADEARALAREAGAARRALDEVLAPGRAGAALLAAARREREALEAAQRAGDPAAGEALVALAAEALVRAAEGAAEAQRRADGAAQGAARARLEAQSRAWALQSAQVARRGGEGAARALAVDAERARERARELEQEAERLRAELAGRWREGEAAAEEAAAEEAAGRDEPSSSALAQLPDAPDALEELRSRTLAELEALPPPRPGAAAEAARARRAAAEAREKLAADAAGLARQREARAAGEARWRAEVRACVSRVDREFGASFAQVGCAGQVVFDEGQALEGGGGPDPEEASLQIRVAFRDGDALAPLDASRQSGGERSVATMLFLVALQRLVCAPFRVVDEINQGMDAGNERKVASLLARASADEGAGQSFLLTPKLLPDLEYHDCVAVLQIFNGPLVQSLTRKRRRGEGDGGSGDRLPLGEEDQAAGDGQAAGNGQAADPLSHAAQDLLGTGRLGRLLQAEGSARSVRVT